MQNLTSATIDSNNILTIDIENGDSVTVDLSQYLDDKDQQLLSLSGNKLFISNGNFVTLTDLDATNELQNITISNDTVFLSNGGFVVLPPKTIDTDQQNLTYASIDSNNVLTIGIENGDSVTVDLSQYLDNTDNQQLSITGDTIYLSNGGYVVLPPGTVDTDQQNLTSATLDSNFILTIDIENGDSVTVDLSTFMDEKTSSNSA